VGCALNPLRLESDHAQPGAMRLRG